MLTSEQLDRLAEHAGILSTLSRAGNNGQVARDLRDALDTLRKLMAAYTTKDGVFIPPGQPVFYGSILDFETDDDGEIQYAVNRSPEELTAPPTAGQHYSYEDTVFMDDCYSSAEAFIEASAECVRNKNEADASAARSEGSG